MIEKIDTHSIDLSKITPGGWVLDVGCRGFSFARILAEKGLKVVALDPDSTITDPNITNVFFEQVALVSKPTNNATYATWSTGEGNHICIDRPVPSYATPYQVQCKTINELMQKYNISQFDIVKLDCEGMEFEILPIWPGPISKQISVEFHDFTGANTQGSSFYDNFLNHISQWYDIKIHEIQDHPCGIKGYWDSLFTLKDNI